MDLITSTPFSVIYDSCNDYCVYKHENLINHKIYIGQTKQEPEKRWDSGWGYKKQYIFKDIITYGWDNFSHEILATHLTASQANELEKYWIQYYHSNEEKFGYNRTSGGSSAMKQNEETNEKRRQANLLYWNSDEGKKKAKIHSARMTKENNPMFGKHHSDETKEKQSRMKKGPLNCNFQKTGFANHLSKPIYCIELKQVFGSGQEAMRKTGVDASSISKCCKNKVKLAGKMHWRYATEEEIEGGKNNG